MGLARKFKRLTLLLIAAANLLVVMALLGCGYAGEVSPERHPTCEVLTLLFPIPLVLNAGFLIFWLIFHYKLALIPIAGFLLCASPVRHYCPLNLGKPAPADGFKVMTLNANIFHYNHDMAKLPNPCIEYLCHSGADIICLQEAHIHQNIKKLTNRLKEAYPYFEREQQHHHERVAVLSRYPIVRHELIEVDSRKNACAAFYIKMGADTLLMVNCHFESSKLSEKERDDFGDLVTRKSNVIDERSIVHKVMRMGRRHARQADAVMAYIKKHRREGMSVMVCGDFNDTPLSYAHHVFARELTDCHTATANGPGFTHRAHGMLVRIDHMFCSSDLQPYGCQIDTKKEISDHYPIICTLKKRQNPKK